MANFLNSVMNWFGGGAMGQAKGVQAPVPMSSIATTARSIGQDAALQIDTVWACIDRRASIVASLPLFVYDRQANGQKVLARTSRLWSLLHDSPNTRMTPFDFWRTMLANYDLRGNAYARIDRDERTGEAVSLWPMPAAQVETVVMDDGALVYRYQLDGGVAFLAEENVLHLRGLGNGTTGMDKLQFMRAGLAEAADQVQAATGMWANANKPAGVLMVDRALRPDQRATISKNFTDMASGPTSRLFVLEAHMKYSQVSMTPEQVQLLESRQFSVEQICRWYDVPPVLVHHANVTAWGSGIEQIVDGFYKLAVRPLLVSVEQSLAKRVMTPAQRARQAVEFSLDALLRGSLKDRMTVYAQAVQNGIKTRNECRQLENDPPLTGADDLTAQTNLAPLAMLGSIASKQGGASEPIAQ